MKFLVVCIFALVATSLAGDTKKGKRSFLGLADAEYVAHELPATTLFEAHHEPLLATQHTHTHTVERVNVPYPVERIHEKIVHVDNPIPQPYPVYKVKHVAEPIHIDRPIAQPYPVEVKVPIEQPIAVPVERVRTIVKQVPFAQHYERQVPQPYPVYIHQEPAISVHAAPIYDAPIHTAPALSVHSSPALSVHSVGPAYHSTRTYHGPLASAINSPLNAW